MTSAREKVPQLGLWDDEVPKRSHDDMVLWAYANAERLVHQYLETFPSRDFGCAISNRWEAIAIVNRSGVTLNALPPMPAKPTDLVKRKVLEPEVTDEVR